MFSKKEYFIFVKGFVIKKKKNNDGNLQDILYVSALF